MAKFSVTYEIVTPESAADCDVAEDGFVVESVSLREAIGHVLETRTSHVSGIESIEASSWPSDTFDWVTVYNGMEYQTGAQESRALHIPRGVTPASRMRILRLVRGY